MQNVFSRLRQSIAQLERAVSGEVAAATEQRILEERTLRIARQPVHIEPAPGAFSCLIFERSSGRYGARLDVLEDVGAMGPIARVPGIPELYLGVTARQGKVVSVIDLPRLFGPAGVERDPAWLIMTGELACGIAADALYDIVEIDARKLAPAMPTFPPLVQKHTLGVLEDRSVIIDVAGLLADRALRVEHRG